MPGPSFRPILGALGTACCSSASCSGAGSSRSASSSSIVTLLGWLIDARREYRARPSKRTGPATSRTRPAPRTPSLLLAALAVLFVGGVVLQSGCCRRPGRRRDTGRLPLRLGVRRAPAAPGWSPQPPGWAATRPRCDATVEAQGIAFVADIVHRPGRHARSRSRSSTRIAGTPHNVEIKDASGREVFHGEIFPGSRPGLRRPRPAGRQYTFVCIRASEHDRDRDAPVARASPAAPTACSRCRRRVVTPRGVLVVVGRSPGRPARACAVGEPAPAIAGHDPRRRAVRPRGAARHARSSSTSGRPRACRVATSSRCSSPSWPSTPRTASRSSGVLTDDPPSRPATFVTEYGARGRP